MVSEITYSKLPEYLRGYVVKQNYDKYTPRDQAAWRFIMRQSRAFFLENAHPIWLDGLRDTGVPLTRIPKIEEMDLALQKYGWGACCICGFIPPAAFLDFLARKVIPIAADMRTLEHIGYTPAPDIVHEAAGHAPIVADEGYRNYLIHYAKLARRAIYSHEDIRVYESIRLLSDLKENPDSTEEQIENAKRALEDATRAMSWVSEASKVARMSWWTIEYGLIGEENNPKIYGAGLLSSISESYDCLNSKVKRLPLSLACVEQTYDITEPQPQLFVAKSFEHMSEVLTELENTMAFKKAGLDGLQMAIKARTVTTVQFENALGVSGILEKLWTYDREASYLRWKGRVQLSLNEVELAGQGAARHPSGFSMPIGQIRGTRKVTSQLTKTDLKDLGLEEGVRTFIQYQSGAKVDGLVKEIRYSGEYALYIVWTDCTVKLGSEVLFEPAWGDYDMPLCQSITSVYGGPADWNLFGDYDIGQASSVPSRSTPYTTRELAIHDLYHDLRLYREGLALGSNFEKLRQIAEKIVSEYSSEWLLAVELLEILNLESIPEVGIFAELRHKVLEKASSSGSTENLIKRGLDLVSIAD
jgi:phenylalanine-4-hydroxylase